MTSIFSAALLAATLTVDGNVPAGNIVVEKIEGDSVHLSRELRGTKGDWFYWAFRVKGAKGRTLNFVFDPKIIWGGPVGVRGPAVTTDGGKTWSYPCDGKSTKNTFSYAFESDDEVRFYETWQYLPPDWDDFLSQYAADRGRKFETSVLCKSRKGRDVPKARFGCLSGMPKHRVFMSSRHHCSEATATPVLEGVAAAFLADDDLGRWLCANVELMVVPFVDYDGAVDGDQGKNRAPHDHNRDYTEFIYPETRAIRDWIGSHAGGRLDVFIDVHCPWIRGVPNEYLYTPWKDPAILPNAASEHRFSDLLERLQCGSMRYKASDDMPFGKDWNTAKNYSQGWSAVIWACKALKGLAVSRSIEVPFANANGAVVTPKACRELGRDTAKVFRAFFTEGDAAPRQSGGWLPYGGNPVLGNAKLGTCFDVNVVTDGPAPYTMYFSWRPKKAIALVRSDDGSAWTQEPEICLEADPTSGWEDNLNRSCTVKKDGVWHMWYTGQAKDAKRGWMSRIGYAMSKDGVRFTRVRRTPVMIPEHDFEKASVMNPYVRWDAKRKLWRMWYAAGETYEPNVLCYAESADGLVWKKWDGNPMFGGAGGITWDRDRVGACEVHPLPDGRWVMFYIGYSDIDTARIGCAISPDGVTGWRRLAQNPIVAPDLGTWNGSACYKPSVVRDERNGRWFLWYNGRNGHPEYVGMAVHEGLDLEAPAAAPADTKKLLSDYVRRFNAKDDEGCTNAIPNAAAETFMQENCPRFACPDKDIERTYYFRWWTFRKHLRRSEEGRWRVTEFLPRVGWAGTDNTIVCPAGHHLREGRWLRDPQYMADDATFWLSSPKSEHRWTYSSWLFTGTRLFAAVSGRDDLPVSLLDDAVKYYERWEQGFERSAWPVAGTVRMGGDGKGGFLSIDNYEGTELSLGGHGYKPLLASAMWSEARSIAEVAREVGRTDLAERFKAKAETNRQSILAHCWNPEIGFFSTGFTNDVLGTVRELHGYAPWYFGMPTDGRRPDWKQLTDPQGFSGRYGLTFPERRAKGFRLAYKGHECQWNGPSWPFATSIALTALMNDLHSTPSPNNYTSLFVSLLWQYADAQRLTRPYSESWEVVPWIDENLNPDTGDWMSRTMLRARDKAKGQACFERGKDYNHSTFCDLVISGLVGVVPSGAKGFVVDPLFPPEWDYLVLENLRYRGHDVTVRWQRGDGLSVAVDGKEVARRADHGRLDIVF